MILPHSSRRAVASSNFSARKSASAARTSSSRRRSSSPTARLSGDGGKRRATLSGPSIVSAAHEKARSTCGSSAALPFGTQTSTRGAAADGGDDGSATNGTTGAAAAPASTVTTKVANPFMGAQAQARPGPISALDDQTDNLSVA